jgi:hypothetical protein
LARAATLGWYFAKNPASALAGVASIMDSTQWTG